MVAWRQRPQLRCWLPRKLERHRSIAKRMRIRFVASRAVSVRGTSLQVSAQLVLRLTTLDAARPNQAAAASAPTVVSVSRTSPHYAHAEEAMVCVRIRFLVTDSEASAPQTYPAHAQE